jgi:hypothetical protein
MFEIKRNRIYKHTELDQREADRFKPLMESAFKDEFARYDNRPDIKAERLRFVTEQYANRLRIAKNMGVSPLYEDANIFGHIAPSLKNLFESVSTPGNVIGMGNVQNPMNMTDVDGGMWNPGYKPGTGDVPSYVFGLQNHLALHCIGFDLIPSIAVDTPKIVISYVDTVYGGGTFDDKDNLPSYVEISSDLFTRSWIKAQKLKRGVSEIILIADTASGKKALKVRFIVGSTVKAALTVEVLATGVATTLPVDSTTTGVFNWNNEYTVKEIIDTFLDTTKNCVVAVNAESTTVADVYVSSAVTDMYINYASATRTNIAEAASNDNSLGGMNRKQQEKGPKHKLNVITMDKQLEMVGLEIEADTSNIQIKDMAAQGVNVISYLYTGVQNQLVQSLDEVILDHLYKLGATHALNAYKSQGINYSLYIDKPSVTEESFYNLCPVEFYDMSGRDVRNDMGNVANCIISSSYENQMTHGERLYSRILLIAEFVGQQNRIAAPDFLVAAGEICATLKKQAKFVTCPSANTLTSNPELHYTGTIFDTINVYKNPKVDFDDPRILMGRRGNDKDPGAKFLGYDLASSRQIVAEQTMAEKIRVWSRFNIADVGFYPELNYYTWIAVNKYQWA